jgi:hypothetical protein
MKRCDENSVKKCDENSVKSVVKIDRVESWCKHINTPFYDLEQCSMMPDADSRLLELLEQQPVHLQQRHKAETPSA